MSYKFGLSQTLDTPKSTGNEASWRPCQASNKASQNRRDDRLDKASELSLLKRARLSHWGSESTGAEKGQARNDFDDGNHVD
jgi:hypothetical protein